MKKKISNWNKRMLPISRIQANLNKRCNNYSKKTKKCRKKSNTVIKKSNKWNFTRVNCKRKTKT